MHLVSSSCCGVSEGGADGRGGVWRLEGRRLRPPDPRRSLGIHGPASWPLSRIACAVVVRTVCPAALAARDPSTSPPGQQRACTGNRPVSRGEARSAFNSGGDGVQVCLITCCFSAPALSHTHPRRVKDGVMMMMMMIGEAVDSSEGSNKDGRDVFTKIYI